MSDDEGREASMRPHRYTGPTGTNDFDDLTADEMSELVASYKLLGGVLRGRVRGGDAGPRIPDGRAAGARERQIRESGAGA